MSRASLTFLIDPMAGGAPVSLVLSSNRELDLNAVGTLLRSVFERDASLNSITLLSVDDRPIGVVTRTRLQHLFGDHRRGALEGDGATLPGQPTAYTLLTYVCPEPVCSVMEWHVMAPPPGRRCPEGHGLLELRR
jgi:hypothetical protein